MWGNERRRRLRYIAGKEPRTSIAGHPELFETKVLRIQDGVSATGKSVSIFSRDPGSAVALVPVMHILRREGMNLSAVIDGRAEEGVRKHFPNSKDITPYHSALAIDQTIRPDVILTTVSSSDKGLETYAAATYTEVPLVLVEDYYGTVNLFLERIAHIKGVRVPDRICVMDEAARSIIVKKYPGLADRVTVTGQPAFDAIAHEKEEQRREKIRTRVGLKENDRLIFYCGSGTPGQDKEFAEVCSHTRLAGGVPENTYLMFKKHSRDNTPLETYDSIIAENHFATLDGARISTEEASVASDVVMTSWSTEGLAAALRGIPVLYVNDLSVRKPPSHITYPLPSVELGAGVSATRINDIPHLLSALLDRESPLSIAVRSAMQRHYTCDGRNAERVASVVREVLRA